MPPALPGSTKFGQCRTSAAAHCQRAGINLKVHAISHRFKQPPTVHALGNGTNATAPAQISKNDESRLWGRSSLSLGPNDAFHEFHQCCPSQTVHGGTEDRARVSWVLPRIANGLTATQLEVQILPPSRGRVFFLKRLATNTAQTRRVQKLAALRSFRGASRSRCFELFSHVSSEIAHLHRQLLHSKSLAKSVSVCTSGGRLFFIVQA